jgi:hypothetical protein
MCAKKAAVQARHINDAELKIAQDCGEMIACGSSVQQLAQATGKHHIP